MTRNCPNVDVICVVPNKFGSVFAETFISAFIFILSWILVSCFTLVRGIDFFAVVKGHQAK